MIQQNMLRAWQQCYTAAADIKEALPEKPKTETEKQAARMVAVLRQYQGCYFSHKQVSTESNLIDLEDATINLRQTALSIREKMNMQTV